jgi:two-component system, cell cycle sensor histidine kinase DivJ
MESPPGVQRIVSDLSKLREEIGALVHNDARTFQLERLRHELFIGSRMAIMLFNLVAMPVYIAMRGVPDLWEAVAFAWLLLPIVAVAHVSRTGKLANGHTICKLGLIGVGATLAAGGGTASAAALAWFILVPFEASFVVAPRRVVFACFVTVAAVLAVSWADWFGILPHLAANSTSLTAAFVLPSVIYALALAYSSRRLQEVGGRMERIGDVRYQSLTEVVGDVVMRHDRTGATLSVGRQCETVFGIAPRELMGRGFFERIHVADRPLFLKTIADALAATEVFTATLRLRTAALDREQSSYKEPVFVWAEMRARRFEKVSDVSGEVEASAVITVIRDITRQKMHEQELDAARAEAERANMWKDRFLANVSHELRTPLNAIIGFSELLGNEELTPRDPVKQREYARIIHASGEHLLAVVNTILDMSKIEAGSFELTPEPFQLADLIASCCDMVRLRAEEASIELVRDIADDLAELVADKRACKQVVLNLLSNAVKFTPSNGRVTIHARMEDNFVLICVSDTGIGIHSQDMPRLGDPFFQARSSYDRPYEGTGLGLSVVRGLVGLHGGTISIESAQGEGTQVMVRLPGDCREASIVATRTAKIEARARRNSAGLRSMNSGWQMVKKIA